MYHVASPQGLRLELERGPENAVILANRGPRLALEALELAQNQWIAEIEYGRCPFFW